MTILFTEEELEYILVEKFKWKVKNGATKSIKENLERKLKILANSEKGEG